MNMDHRMNVPNRSPQWASAEASRCLSCYDAPCAEACPVHLDVPAFIRRIKTADFRGAVTALRKDLALPDTCALICPHLKLCEGACCSKELSGPIDIGAIQHFVATLGRELEVKERRSAPSGKKVAIIGAGPAGLAAGKDLMAMGHDVTVFESQPMPGGLLTYGIPAYRLPQEVSCEEVQYIKDMGLAIHTGEHIGNAGKLLENGFDAVLIAIGAHEGLPLNIPGEELNGVKQGIDFIKGFNSGAAESLSGKRVAVIGGGDVAIDAARCSVRLDAQAVYVIYRRSFDEMPAYEPEIEDAKKEGVIFWLLTVPVAIIGHDGDVKSLECVKTSLGELDESGRRRPIPIPESRFEIEIDMVIEAIGQRVDESFIQSNPDIETANGLIKVDEHLMTSHRGIFAAGDVVRGGSTVVQSIADGKRAVAEIDRFLRGGQL
ncbi:NAD(P)-dependent oxidoreductase [Dehalococcoidia bacterium]|nr:NAD(P)-dependent oxidoreductase [Dehalococcoidia bacterium]